MGGHRFKALVIEELSRLLMSSMFTMFAFTVDEDLNPWRKYFRIAILTFASCKLFRAYLTTPIYLPPAFRRLREKRQRNTLRKKKSSKRLVHDDEPSHLAHFVAASPHSYFHDMVFLRTRSSDESDLAEHFQSQRELAIL